MTTSHVRRRIDMRRVVHARGDALRQHAGLGVVVDALDLDVFEVGPVGRLIAETMREVIKLEPHAIGEILLERHPTNLFCHRNALPYTHMTARALARSTLAY